jgi:hypothetical protein
VNVAIHGIPVTSGASLRNQGPDTSITTDAAPSIFALPAIAAPGEHAGGAVLRTESAPGRKFYQMHYCPWRDLLLDGS